MRADLREAIIQVKDRYIKEGFIILGVFGSQARGDATDASDLDVLYRIENQLLAKYPGWTFCTIYDQVQQDLQKQTGKTVDLADIEGLTNAGKKYILPEVEYV